MLGSGRWWTTGPRITHPLFTINIPPADPMRLTVSEEPWSIFAQVTGSGSPHSLGEAAAYLPISVALDQATQTPFCHPYPDGKPGLLGHPVSHL